MKLQRISLKMLGFILCFIVLTSFNKKPKPHLIVGLWKITEENKVCFEDSNKYISQLYFSSDEISSIFSFSDMDGKFKDGEIRLAFQTYDTIPPYKKPVVYFINTCDKNFKLAFTIEKLTKDSLELKCIREITSKNILLNREIISFERIGGPPENMSSSEDANQIEAKEVDAKKNQYKSKQQ